MRNYVIENFKSLFYTTNSNVLENLDQLISWISIESENRMPEEIPNAGEIEVVIINMNSLEALGSDGMPALFYKKYCSIIKDDLISEIQNIFRNSHLLVQRSTTFVTLIPKK